MIIKWIKYDPNNREIISHVNYLVTNGRETTVAQHINFGSGDYGWVEFGGYRLRGITHHTPAPINLPDKEEEDET